MKTFLTFQSPSVTAMTRLMPIPSARVFLPRN